MVRRLIEKVKRGLRKLAGSSDSPAPPPPPPPPPLPPPPADKPVTIRATAPAAVPPRKKRPAVPAKRMTPRCPRSISPATGHATPHRVKQGKNGHPPAIAAALPRRTKPQPPVPSPKGRAPDANRPTPRPVMTAATAPGGTARGAMVPVTMDCDRKAPATKAPARTARVPTARPANTANARTVVRAVPARTAAPAKNAAPGKNADRVKTARPRVARIPARSPPTSSGSPN